MSGSSPKTPIAELADRAESHVTGSTPDPLDWLLVCRRLCEAAGLRPSQVLLLPGTLRDQAHALARAAIVGGLVEQLDAELRRAGR